MHGGAVLLRGRGAAVCLARFVRYTDVVVLGCAVVAVVAAWKLRALPTAVLGWWLGSVAVFGAGMALFDDLVHGGPLRSGYRPGEVTLSLACHGGHRWRR